MKKIGLVVLLLAAGIAVAGNVKTVVVNTTGNTRPQWATEGAALNTSATGAPIQKVKVTVQSTGSFVGGYLKAYRFVKDAGWARDIRNDQVILDGGALYTGGGEIQVMPDIAIGVTGNSSRITFQTASILYEDAGTAVPTIITEVSE